MWDKLFTLIRCSDAPDEANGDRSALLGEGWAERDRDEGTGRGFAGFGVAVEAAGAGCSERGWKRGLGGGWRLAAVLASEGVCWGGCAGVELGGGAAGSAMCTSPAGATIRGSRLALTCGEGRTGVWWTADDSWAG